MTIQAADSCTVDGRNWLVMDWAGDRACVPGNASMGFDTVAPHTGNWSGRIDHFYMVDCRLMLFKMEVSLAPEYAGFVPPGARREVVLRGDWREAYSGDHQYREFIERRTEYFVFDDLQVAFTGRLHLGHPDRDKWQRPWPDRAPQLPPYQHFSLDFGDENEPHRRTLHFERGRLVA